MTFGLKKRQEADIKDVLELNKSIIILLNKSDLITIGSGVPSIILSSGKKMNASFVSFASKDTAVNIDLVRVQLQGVLKETGLAQSDLLTSDAHVADNFLVTRHRHRVLLEQTLHCLDNFLQDDLQVDMAAEELRLAVQCVSRVTGHIDVEEMLDVLFADFCIGK